MQNRESRKPKSWTFGLTTTLALVLLFPSFPKSASADLDSLKTEQNQQQQKLDQAKDREKAAKDAKDKFQQQLNVNAAEINQLSEQIDVKESEIARLASSIFTTTQQVDKTKVELAAAEVRVKERNELVKQRIRLMYEKGDVEYLEVLFGATSFSDFIDRFEALQVIYEKDKELLTKNRAERDEVKTKKQQLETQRTQLAQLKSSQEAEKSTLDGLKGQKVAINKQLEANKQEHERIEQEQLRIQDDAIKSLYAISAQIEEEKRKQATVKQPVPNAGGGGSDTFTGGFAWPTPSSYVITSEWGNRADPFTGMRAGHNGMDIGAPTGTSVVAAQAGTVIRAGFWSGSGFGNVIIIDHGGGLWSLYGHLVNGGVLVSVGQEVRKGDVIGQVGSTGRSTGPHLHFGVYENGKDVNPRKYL